MKLQSVLCVLILVLGQISLAKNTELFSNTEALEMSLEAPFSELFKHRVSPWTPGAPGDKDYAVQGKLSYKDKKGKIITLNPMVSMRGNSSQDIRECPFPKLKLKFKSEISGTLFEGNPTVGIATHCGSQGGKSGLGRPWNGLSPHREIIAYQVLQTLKIPTFQTRIAWFSYTESANGQSLGRQQAFFLENIKSAAERFGMPEHENISREFKSVEEAPGVTELDAARIYFAEGLIANWDWHLKVKKATPLPGENIHKIFWNMKAFVSNGKWLIIPYDFDLSQIVTLRFNRDLKIDRIPGTFSQEIRQQVIGEFEGKRSEVLSLVEKLSYDPEAQRAMQNHFQWFYQNLGKLSD